MITLRDADGSDRDRLFAWRNLPDVRRWMYTDHEITREEHDAWFDAMLRDTTKKYWIIQSDGAPIGSVNLVGLTQNGSSCAFGIYLGVPQIRGSGAAQIALEKAIEYAFLIANIDRISADALVDNGAAIGLYRKVGMTEDGCAKQSFESKDAVHFRLDRTTWERSRISQEKLP